MREVEILKKKQLKCYLYTRVSTSMQVDGYSLDAQRDKLRKYAAYEDMIVAGEYSDEGFSGKNIQGRQEFQRMLNDIQDGKDDVSYVLVFKLSRFGRNAADVLNSLQLMQDFGVNLICVEDGIDSSKDAGKLMISVLSAVAEIERENIRTQTMAGREQKAREGKWNGGFAPYGYKLENGNLVIAEDEVEVIRVIYDRYIHTNEGVAGVAKYLNRNGYTKKLRQNNTIPGFSRDFVKNVLYNPVYMGKIAYGRRRTEKKQGTRNEMHVVEQSEFPVYEGQHEAIISEEDWYLAQEKRKINSFKREKVNNPDHAHILSGILKCPCCGKSMYGNIAKAHSKDKKTRYYYYCKNTVTPTGHECSFRLNIEQTEINKFVAKVISAMVNNPRFVEAIQAKIGTAVDTEDMERQIAVLQGRLKQAFGTKSRLERQMDTLDINDAHYDRKILDLQRRYDEQYDTIEEIEVQIGELQSQIRSIQQEKISGDNIYRLLLAFDEVYHSATEAEQKEFMKAFIERIEMFPEKRKDGSWIKKIVFNFPVPVDGEEVKELPLETETTVELYSVQRYLQYDTLAQNGLQHFDSWASTFGETVTALELAPEGTNYRAKTRFAKFYNLPELMQMFREVADIQTADMLKLPVPKVNYRNIKTKPSEIQTEMVASLAKRAEKVRARLVEPNIDNMLKITNDGRKLALDQRMIDPMLPDDPDSKVNACVDNVYRIWEEHADTKATQLVFCDLSTPKNDGTFNVYDDMREKLIARGIPAGQIRFIHEATTDAQKKELFGKVRSGEVRVLLGSTPKMGAGTNVQDRLIAIHNLDCPWRPSDLEQRQGRIERQGNMFPEVEVYRYVTEQTFDAYLYQLVESKQKFISQIMTSKSPVRSAEDVDEVALSFAEVKMLATGDARFKEKMDLDIQVSKLRVLKQSYLSEHYDLEDRVLKYYPQTIKEYEERIAGYENDAALAEQHKPQGEDKFCPMTLKGVTYTEKADAGEMLLAICKDYPMSAATEIGSYRGFRIEIYYDTVNAHYCMNLCGKTKHKVDLGSDALGNLTRIENELSKLPARLEAAKTKKAEIIAQLEIAKEEIKKPFAFEDELKEKTERLNALNIELNLNEKDTSVMDTEPEQAEEQPERKCASRER